MQSWTRTLAALIAAPVLFATACDNDATQPNSPTTTLTVIHATAALGAINVAVGDQTVVANLAFGSAASSVAVPAGLQRIRVSSGGSLISDFEAVLTAEHVNALVVANGTAHVAGTVIPDTGAVATNRANLRLVNVVGSNDSEPTLLDILINMPGVNPDSTARLAGMDARIASYSSLLYFDPGSFRLRYVPQGTTTVLAEVEFEIAQGETKVAVLERDPDGTYRVTIVAESSAVAESGG